MLVIEGLAHRSHFSCILTEALGKCESHFTDVEIDTERCSFKVTANWWANS